jgi:hypothetical protein
MLPYSFSSPLLIDLRASNESIAAVRVVVRSLGICREESKDLGILRTNDEAEVSVCYAAQIPEDARACVKTVNMVAFEVRLTCAHVSLL